MDKQKIGIIGHGFVGQAIHHGFSSIGDFRIHDPKTGFHTIKETVEESEFIFICVPTPTKADTGAIDLSILRGVLSQCDEVCYGVSTAIFIVKSTVVPGTMEKLQGEFPWLNLVHSPEFLTERNHLVDFENQSRLVLGGVKAYTNRVEELFKLRFPHLPVFTCDFATAEMIKYVCNCFFSVKVSFFNEIYQVCESLGIEYDEVVCGSLMDGRIGRSHCLVPGTDGQFGFGGKCFPKDLTAMIQRAIELGVDPKLMQAAQEKNLEVRPARDWESIEGAISNEG